MAFPAIGSAFDRAVRPTDWNWQLQEHLLAAIADTIRWIAWTKTKGAKHGQGRPDPIPRPGVKPAHERIGTAAPLDTINRLLGWR